MPSDKEIVVTLKDAFKKLDGKNDILDFPFRAFSLGKYGKKRVPKATIQLPEGKPFFVGDDLQVPKVFEDYIIKVVLIKKSAVERLRKRLKKEGLENGK